MIHLGTSTRNRMSVHHEGASHRYWVRCPRSSDMNCCFVPTELLLQATTTTSHYSTASSRLSFSGDSKTLQTVSRDLHRSLLLLPPRLSVLSRAKVAPHAPNKYNYSYTTIQTIYQRSNAITKATRLEPMRYG